MCKAHLPQEFDMETDLEIYGDVIGCKTHAEPQMQGTFKLIHIHEAMSDRWLAFRQRG